MSTIKSILTAYMATADIQIETDNFCPPDCINYGVSISDDFLNYFPSGIGDQSYQYTDALGGDWFALTIIATSRANCIALLLDAVEACEDFTKAGGDSTYGQLYPYVKKENIQFNKTKRSFRFEVTFPLLASKNNKQLYS